MVKITGGTTRSEGGKTTPKSVLISRYIILEANISQ
jgi:hypothetical protein